MLNFEDILRKKQFELKKALMIELNALGYRTRTQKGFVYAKGSVPVMLVAHMDTVHKTPVKTICYSPDGKIAMSPEGIGGDDRAGVHMILEIVKKHKCHVLFCEDEEIGGIGASVFAKSGIKPDVNYIVELDRRGKNDAVFYDCDNPDFTRFVCGFGFEEDMGSFSDISVIAPVVGVAAVNISAGYFNEHKRHEYINLENMNRNIGLVGKMVQAETERFEYLERQYFRGKFGGGFYEDWFDLRGLYEEDSTIEKLMPLPESAHIRNRGQLFDGEGYFIDWGEKVYEYYDDLGVAVRLEGAEACTAQGLTLKYDEADAEPVEVVPEEYVYEAYEEDFPGQDDQTSN